MIRGLKGPIEGCKGYMRSERADPRHERAKFL